MNCESLSANSVQFLKQMLCFLCFFLFFISCSINCLGDTLQEEMYHSGEIRSLAEAVIAQVESQLFSASFPFCYPFIHVSILYLQLFCRANLVLKALLATSDTAANGYLELRFQTRGGA